MLYVLDGYDATISVDGKSCMGHTCLFCIP